jgi:hypothetical protein
MLIWVGTRNLIDVTPTIRVIKITKQPKPCGYLSSNHQETLLLDVASIR